MYGKNSEVMKNNETWQHCCAVSTLTWTVYRCAWWIYTWFTPRQWSKIVLFFFLINFFCFFFYLRGPLFLTAFVEFSFSKIPYILVLRIPVPYLSVWKIYGIGMMRQNDCHSLFFGGCLTLASQECYSVAYYRSKRKNWLVLAEITRKFENLRTLHTFSEVSLR